LLVRELDERLGLSELIAEHLTDSRGKNTQLPMANLSRQAVYSRLAGYEDVNDAERLSQDPTFRLIGSEKIWERGAALPALVRDRGAEPRGEPGRSGPDQSRTAGEGSGCGFTSEGGVGYGQHRNPGLWRTRAKCLQRAF